MQRNWLGVLDGAGGRKPEHLLWMQKIQKNLHRNRIKEGMYQGRYRSKYQIMSFIPILAANKK